jgi:hypothetical protein
MSLALRVIESSLFQIADSMDQPCKKVDFLQNKGEPYVKDYGYPCHDVSGNDVSKYSKRDIGVTLNIIITYKNKSVQECRIHLTTKIWSYV